MTPSAFNLCWYRSFPGVVGRGGRLNALLLPSRTTLPALTFACPANCFVLWHEGQRILNLANIIALYFWDDAGLVYFFHVCIGIIWLQLPGQRIGLQMAYEFSN